jgi:hypothetical protein
MRFDCHSANGIQSILEQMRVDNDVDLNAQIENFYQSQNNDQKEFLLHFDPTDHQAVFQAIQMQVNQRQRERERTVFNKTNSNILFMFAVVRLMFNVVSAEF